MLCKSEIGDILLKLSLIPTTKTLRSKTGSQSEVNTKKLKKSIDKDEATC